MRPLQPQVLDLVDLFLQEVEEARLDSAETLGKDLGDGVAVAGKLGQVRHKKVSQVPGKMQQKF